MDDYDDEILVACNMFNSKVLLDHIIPTDVSQSGVSIVLCKNKIYIFNRTLFITSTIHFNRYIQFLRPKRTTAGLDQGNKMGLKIHKENKLLL